MRMRPFPILLTLLALAGTAAAQLDPALLDRLDDPAWEVRQAASEELLSDAGMTPGRLLEALPAEGERPEVRARLLDAVEHHALRLRREGAAPEVGGAFERAGRRALLGPEPGALGVSHRAFPPGTIPGVEGPCIAVVKTLAGFPAHTLLRAGDLITGLNGRPVAWPDRVFPEPGQRRPAADEARNRLAAEATQAANLFSEAVQNAGAGNRVTLAVFRDGRTLELPVTLARSASLQSMHPAGGRPAGGDLDELLRGLDPERLRAIEDLRQLLEEPPAAP